MCIMWGNKQLVRICIFYLAITEPQREDDPKSETIVYNSPVQAQDGMYIYVLNKRNHFAVVCGYNIGWLWLTFTYATISAGWE